MNLETQILIVGAGASGSAAAIAAARAGARVLVVEGNKEIGRKILSTGNGKCNFTNLQMDPGFFHGGDPSFIGQVLARRDVSWIRRFFAGMGIYARQKRDGLYPNSGAASDVREALRVELKRLGVEFLTDCRIHKIKQTQNGYMAFGNRAFKHEAVVVEAGAVILATGGMAAPHTGSDGEGLKMAAALGHRLIHPLPALVALKCGEDYFAGLGSIRVNGRISVFIDGEEAASDTGELQLREDGISGIPAFQVSAIAARGLYEERDVEAEVDFFPELSQVELESELETRLLMDGWGKSAHEALLGFLPAGVLETLFSWCDLEYYDDASAFIPRELKRLARGMKHLRITVIGTRGFDGAQTTSGGIDVREIKGDTLESRQYPGLFFAGEIMDVDGICGGYNLHWAFATGSIAGESAANAVM